MSAATTAARRRTRCGNGARCHCNCAKAERQRQNPKHQLLHGVTPYSAMDKCESAGFQQIVLAHGTPPPVNKSIALVVEYVFFMAKSPRRPAGFGKRYRHSGDFRRRCVASDFRRTRYTCHRRQLAHTKPVSRLVRGRCVRASGNECGDRHRCRGVFSRRRSKVEIVRPLKVRRMERVT